MRDVLQVWVTLLESALTANSLALSAQLVLKSAQPALSVTVLPTFMDQLALTSAQLATPSMMKLSSVRVALQAVLAAKMTNVFVTYAREVCSSMMEDVFLTVHLATSVTMKETSATPLHLWMWL